MNCRQIGKGLGLLLLALLLAGCRIRADRKPDVIVNIPLNPTEAVSLPVEESEPPTTTVFLTEPVTEEMTEAATRPAQVSRPTEPKPTLPQYTEPRLVKNTALAQRVADAVNAQRQNAGLEPLRLDSGLCAAADVRAREQQVALGSIRPDGSGWETVLGGHSYGFAAELIHYGDGTGIVDRWMDSRLHRGKLLSESVASMGVAAYTAGDTTYISVIVVG